MINRIMSYRPLTNSPIIATFEVNAIHGIVANGNCSAMTAFNVSFMLVKSSILLKTATQNVGTIAISRVKSTRFHRAHCKLRNPSIANWPEYVPVMVLLWPAAKMPMAQMYMAAAPNVQPKKMPLL